MFPNMILVIPWIFDHPKALQRGHPHGFQCHDCSRLGPTTVFRVAQLTLVQFQLWVATNAIFLATETTLGFWQSNMATGNPQVQFSSKSDHHVRFLEGTAFRGSATNQYLYKRGYKHIQTKCQVPRETMAASRSIRFLINQSQLAHICV